jgi:cardiolipin synthase
VKILWALLLSLSLAEETSWARKKTNKKTPAKEIQAATLSVPALQGSTALLVTPDPGHTAFVKAIEEAKKSIRIEMFHLTHPKVIDALKTARQNKVQIQVIVDRSSLRSKRFKIVTDAMKAIGIEVEASTPKFALTHSKMMLVDDKFALVTAINLTQAEKTTRDFGIRTEDPKVLSDLKNIFETDWKNALEKGKDTPNIQSPNLVVSPINSEQKLADLIFSAQKNINSTVENLGSKTIEKAMMDAVQRKVPVRLILPTCDKNFNRHHNDRYAKVLQEKGVEIRMMPFPETVTHPYMHSKMIAVDQRLAYVGSVNFSTNSLQKAREIGLIFQDKSLIDPILKIFEEDWVKSVPLDFTNRRKCTGSSKDSE